MLVIKNGKILTMAGKVYEPGCVFIDNNKIIEVLELCSDEEISRYGIDKNNIIDATNMCVMPGLIEPHCHIGLIEEKKGEEGDDCNEGMAQATPYIRAIDGINPFDPAFHDAIKAGITSVMVGPGSSNVVGGQFAVIKTHGRVVDDMVLLSPAAIKVSFGENVKNNFMALQQVPSNRMSIAAVLREELSKAKAYRDKKITARKENSHFEKDFKLESYIPVIEKKIPLKAHVHRADDIMTAIRIAKEFDVLLTLDHCTEGHLICDEILKSNYPAIVGPDLVSRDKTELQYADFKTVGVLNKAGVLVSLTTDHPVSLIKYLPLCAAYAAKKGLGVEEGLKAITINAAKICGVSDRVGSIEKGKDADIVIFSGNPMEIFTDTIYTIINGQVVYSKDEEDAIN